MTDQEFEIQYAQSGSTGFSIRNDAVCRRWAAQLDGESLLEALTERITEQMPLDSELEALLAEIAARLPDGA